MLDDVYRTARTRVASLVSTLSHDQLETQVPATPEWTVHDLIAHLVGGASDAASGRVDGAPGPAWTARHVAERTGLPVDQLLTEWEHAAPAVETSLAGQKFTGPSLAADVICHEGDLREALGLSRVDRDHWHQQFLDVFLLLLGQRLGESATVQIQDEHGQEWQCGSGEPVIRLDVDGYELLRAMFSRRSRGQISSWNWSSQPTEQVIDSFGVFGSRDDDQPIPGSHQKASI